MCYSGCHIVGMVWTMGVQGRFTGMLYKLRFFNYGERLDKSTLFSLELWRLKSDLIDIRL